VIVRVGDGRGVGTIHQSMPALFRKSGWQQKRGAIAPFIFSGTSTSSPAFLFDLI